MFLSVWHYLMGYVIVEITGFAPEKLINMALHHHLTFWDVTSQEGKIHLKTTIKAFKLLKPCAKKAKCHIHILEKKGLPFISFRYRKRSILAGGSLLFIVLLYFLSSFVWHIEVIGADRVGEMAVVDCLKKNGYDVGKWKNKLDLREAEKVLIKAYPDIVWTGIKFEGTKLLVQVSESVPKPSMIIEGEPSHLVAIRDALVTYIVTERGMPQVKKGDIVQKGQILVSGKMDFTEKEGSYLTEAKATIRGKTVYSLKASLPLTQKEKAYTAETANSYCLTIFDKKIPVWRTHKVFENYDVLITSTPLRLGNSLTLPIYWDKYEYVAYDYIFSQLDLEEAKDKLLGGLNDKLLELMDQTGEILYRHISYQQQDNTLIAVFHAVVEENIIKSRPLLQEELIPQKLDDEQASLMTDFNG